MNPVLADVQVCLPGRGCVYYVPGVGQALNAAIAIGPRAIDAWLTAALIGLVLVAVIAVLAAVLAHRRPRIGERISGAIRASVAALLVAGAASAAVPSLVPATAPVGEGFVLVSSACVGVALLVLATRLPRVASAVLTAAGALRLLALPVAVAQLLLAAPLGPTPTDSVTVLGELTLALGGLVLLLTGRRFGVLRWALLLPPLAALLTAARLGLPFAVRPWIDLLPDVAIAVLGVLVLVVRTDGASAARGPRWTAVVISGAPAALAVTLAVLLGSPTRGVGGPAAGEPPIGHVRVVSASTRVELPLDAYRQPLAERRDVTRAENVLLEACAARSRVVVQAADLLPPPMAESDSSQLGLIDAGRAARTGYWTKAPEEPSGGADDDHTLRILAGCVRSAQARLGDDGRPQQVVENAVDAASAHADADSRVRRVGAAWSRCMQRRGFFYPTPSAVAQVQMMTFPTPQDTRTASDDVACERATDLPGVRAAVLTADEERTIAAHTADLIRARVELDAQTRRAASVLRAT